MLELSIKAGADMFLDRPVSCEALCEHVTSLLVGCGRLSRRSSHHDVLRFAQKAANGARSRAASSFQSGPAAAATVPRSAAKVNVSGGDNRHLAYEPICPECRGALEYRQVANPHGARSGGSQATRAVALHVGLVLQQRGM